MILHAQKFIFAIAIPVALFLFAYSASAATTLYFSPSEGILGPGSTVAVDVLIDVTECVNAIEADISFPYESMQLSDFIIGESILALWIEQPNEADIKKSNGNGIIHFIGGVPGGYCGKIPGDTGESNTVAKLIFNIPSMQVSDNIRSALDLAFLSSTKVLLNDGFGTADVLTTKSANFSYQNQATESDKTWEKELESDTVPPEPFVVELNRKKDVYDNQYYIIFSTVDKQSGMDHFEILEIRQDQELGAVKDLNWWEKLIGKKKQTIEWKQGAMPYLLLDQELLSTIRVKAVDKAGNERFVEYIPPEARAKQIEKGPDYELIIPIAIVSIVILVILIIIIRKIIAKKRYDKE